MPKAIVQDTLNIADMLHGYHPGTSSLSDLVRFIYDSAGFSTPQVSDGGHAHGFHDVAIINNDFSSIPAANLVADGALIV